MGSSTAKPYTYDAFISYRHVEPDKTIATRLQKLLEAYKPPKGGTYKNTRRIRKVFRDESELPTSGDLGADIQRALEQSAFLIVVCSENTPKSQWCLQEITYFKKLQRGQSDRILALLVDGDPKKAFPAELCSEWEIVRYPDGREELQQTEIEPLAANVFAKSKQASFKKLKTEFLRIAAPILGCGFDDLYRRHQRRFVRKVITLSTAITAVLLSFSAFTYSQYMKIDRQSAQIFNQKSEIEKAYVDLEASSVELQKTNNALEQTNDKLTTQIDETNRQKNLAEENRREAEVQAALARKNEQTALLNEQEALRNLQYANEQKELALANENKAVLNLNMAREQQLFRTVQYAEQLATGGDRVQAAAILKEAHSRFDTLSPRYPEFIKKIEFAEAAVAYYPAYSSYLKLDEEGFQIRKSTFSEDDRYFAVADWYTTTVRNTSDGEIVRTFSSENTIESLHIKDHYLIAAAFYQLYIWDIATGELIYKDKNYDFHDMKTIMCSDESNVIILGHGSGIIFLPYPWLTGIQTAAEIWDLSFSYGNISSNGRYAISRADTSRSKQAVRVLDLGRFSKDLTEEGNLEQMTIAVLPSETLYTGDYMINNEGILYYKTVKKDDTGATRDYYANLYDVSNRKEIVSFEISVGDNLLLQNDWNGKTFVSGSGGVRWIDSKNFLAVKDALRTELNNYPSNYSIDFIPGTGHVLITDTLTKNKGAVYRLDGTKIAELNGFADRILVTEVSHDGGTILACAQDGMMILYKTKSGFNHQASMQSTWSGYGSDCIANNGICHSRTDGEQFYDLVGQKIVSKISFSDTIVEYALFSAFSEDSQLAFGCEYNDSGFRAYRVWNVASGKIVNSLSFLGEYDVMAVYGISPDFRYLIKSVDTTMIVYNIEEQQELYRYDYKQFTINNAIGIEDDGKTAWTLEAGNFSVIDMASGTIINSLSLKFDGEYIDGFSANLKQNRLLLNYIAKRNGIYECGSAIYTTYSGEPLLLISSLVDEKYWKYSPGAHLIYAYDGKSNSGALITVPDFETIRADSERIAGKRVLSTTERQLCGLSIFN